MAEIPETLREIQRNSGTLKIFEAEISLELRNLGLKFSDISYKNQSVVSTYVIFTCSL